MSNEDYNEINRAFERNDDWYYIDNGIKCRMGLNRDNLDKAQRAMDDGNSGRLKFIVKEAITEKAFNSTLRKFVDRKKSLINNDIISRVDILLQIADYFYTKEHEMYPVADDDLYQSAVAKIQSIQGGDVTHGFVSPNRMERTAKHVFKTLGGTIDKIFGVNESDNPDDSGKKSFEWFVKRPFKDGLRKKGDEISVLVSYKIDGMPIEAEIDTASGRILSAITRGDEDAGVDVSELYKDKVFDLSDKFSDKTIGVKFEQVLTFKNLKALSKRKNKKYKNVRNGLGGILRDKEGKEYSDLITLIPLELESKSFGGGKDDAIDILSEISDIGLEYTVINGTVKDLITEFMEYQEDIIKLRPSLPYQIDGLVVEYLDEDLRKAYGRKGRTWDYQRAYKFPASEQTTVLKSVDFSIGHTGKLSMVAIYEPVDFGVCINDRASIGSYKRFKELDLHIGDRLLIGYNNDVIPYIKRNISRKENKRGRMIDMLQFCPACDSKLKTINENENDLYCVNPKCPEAKIFKLVNFLDRLGAKQINEKTVRKLYKAKMVKDVGDFFKLNVKDFKKIDNIKDKAANNLMRSINVLRDNKYTESDIVYALSLNDIGKETSDTIMRKYPLDKILSKDFDFDCLKTIDGIGSKKVERFKDIIKHKETLNELSSILNIVVDDKPVSANTVVFSGFRDKDFEKSLIDSGFDIGENVTSNTAMLFVKDKKANSNKMNKAKSLNIPIIKYDKNNMLKTGNRIVHAVMNS